MLFHLADLWRNFLRRIPPLLIWALLFLAAWPVKILGCQSLLLFGSLFWLNAFVLAWGRPLKKRLLATAAFFLIIWALLILILNFEAAPNFISKFFYGLSLGLNLMMAVSPIKLSKDFARLCRPVFGEKNSFKLAVAVTLLVKLIPLFISSALEIKTTLQKRCLKLSLKEKIVLWAKSLIRQSQAQEEALARAILKREDAWK